MLRPNPIHPSVDLTIIQALAPSSEFQMLALGYSTCRWPTQPLDRGMAKNLSIVVVEKNRERALMIVDGLRGAGEFDVVVVGEETGLGV